MESKELRIGNLLLDNDKIICEVKEIRENYILTNSLDNFKTLVAQIGLYEPIPLTKEWLLKFGFDNWFGKEYILSNGHFYCVFKFYKNGRIDTYFCGQNERFKNKDTRFIKYVHQLQNLYFALTGEELTTQELNQ